MSLSWQPYEDLAATINHDPGVDWSRLRPTGCPLILRHLDDDEDRIRRSALDSGRDRHDAVHGGAGAKVYGRAV